ncbi:single-stranded DNA-binding protein [Campylobacter mucosalis]|uniref:single-stranded DNA-binding protein n=1 Tax=Campylobacter mucosalis TaxID=202 RepID=UPI0004D42632|nr:single-stranded DNA-binding protein [Campylobacter mucosalis]KEA46345.1 single-stranded DNA-binding protein [Campylobacter mucosalis]QKF63177.1 single-stranded DNA binding protein [Campylobacter mucosalis]
MFNKVVLVGNLTRDIELRYTTNGAAIGNTGMAVTRRFTTNNEKREETCFIDITFFGKQAEIANQYLGKGSKLLVEGRLKFDQWTDNNGQNRSKHSVSVENMEMLGGGQNNNQGGFNQNNQNGFNNQGYQGGSNYGGGYNNSQNSYAQTNNQQSFGQQRVQNQPQNRANNDYYDEKIQDIDVDADKFDSEDNIPF